MLNQKDLEMLWCATEECLFQFAENGQTDPRFKVKDWHLLLNKLEFCLSELGQGNPVKVLRKKI